MVSHLNLWNWRESHTNGYITGYVQWWARYVVDLEVLTDSITEDSYRRESIQNVLLRDSRGFEWDLDIIFLLSFTCFFMSPSWGPLLMPSSHHRCLRSRLHHLLPPCLVLLSSNSPFSIFFLHLLSEIAFKFIHFSLLLKPLRLLTPQQNDKALHALALPTLPWALPLSSALCSHHTESLNNLFTCNQYLCMGESPSHYTLQALGNLTAPSRSSSNIVLVNGASLDSFKQSWLSFLLQSNASSHLIL